MRQRETERWELEILPLPCRDATTTRDPSHRPTWHPPRDIHLTVIPLLAWFALTFTLHTRVFNLSFKISKFVLVVFVFLLMSEFVLVVFFFFFFFFWLLALWLCVCDYLSYIILYFIYIYTYIYIYIERERERERLEKISMFDCLLCGSWAIK